MDNIDLLKSLLSTNQIDRLKKEKAAQNRIDDPKLPRHTIYQGDRKIQQLGQDTIENGLIINNQSVAIGDGHGLQPEVCGLRCEGFGHRGAPQEAERAPGVQFDVRHRRFARCALN